MADARYDRWEELASQFDLNAENLTELKAWKKAAKMVRDEIELMKREDAAEQEMRDRMHKLPGA